MKMHRKNNPNVPGILAAAVLLGTGCAGKAQDAAQQVAEQIRNEAVRPNQSDVGRPLPLATTWSCGVGFVTPEYFGAGFPPIVQIGYIEAGHHVIPMFGQPNSDRWAASTFADAARRDKWLQSNWEYYEAPTVAAAKLGIPIAFSASQWECKLIDDKLYSSLPPDQNPAVIDLKGNVTKIPDPLGPIDLWYKVGREYTDNAFMRKMEDLYPNPPLVEFYSNNEEAKLKWEDAETSKRYVDQYGLGRSKDFMHKVIIDGDVERYRALQKGMRDGLSNPNWQKAAIFTGYDTFGLDWSRAWDGGTPSYYVNNWQPTTDYTVSSPQVYLQAGWIPTLKKMRQATPDFRFEMLTWDGNTGTANDKRRFYLSKGQSYDANRYEGYVQFGLWLLQPRVIEDFRANESRVSTEPYYMSLIHSVDRIYASPDLRRFWRLGQLVPNRAHPNPDYEINLPKAPDVMPTDDRWFLLDTSADKPRPWTATTEIPVYSLAYVLGQAPRREWLVFAYSPLGAHTDVKITLPDYGQITVNAPQTGSFYKVTEATKQVEPIVEGGPASVNLAAPPSFVKPGEAATFSAADPYLPGGALNSFDWNFGDGATATGAQQTHAFAKAGLYLVSLHATDGKGTEVNRSAPIVVASGAQKGLVLNYPMVKTPNPFLYDASGRGNIGFMTGGTWVDDPDRGSVLELNGKGDNVTITNTPDINTANNYANRTVMLWFKAGVIAPKKRQAIYEEGGNGNGLNIYLDGARLYGGIWEVASHVGTFIPFDDEIQAGRWYHVAIVLRNAEAAEKEGKFEMYVNGSRVTQDINGGPGGNAAILPGHVGDINFGSSGNTRYYDRPSDGPGEYFTGRLGGLWIYNRALSPEEIAAAAKG